MVERTQANFQPSIYSLSSARPLLHPYQPKTYFGEGQERFSPYKTLSSPHHLSLTPVLSSCAESQVAVLAAQFSTANLPLNIETRTHNKADVASRCSVSLYFPVMIKHVNCFHKAVRESCQRWFPMSTMPFSKEDITTLRVSDLARYSAARITMQKLFSRSVVDVFLASFNAG